MIDFSPLSRWLETRIAADGTPGLGLAITDRSETIYLEHVGFANLDARTPLGPTHAIENGSIGKTFTALLFMILQERGQVDVHAPVTRYLPWFQAGPDPDAITLHHLLSHTAGIIEGSDLACDGRFEAWLLRDQPLLAEPGTEPSYSNLGYKVLGYVAEEILGIPCAEAIRREILEPLGMRHSLSPITNEDRNRLAVGYRRPFDDRPWRVSHGVVPDVWIETASADGSIATTTGDLAMFTRVLLNRGVGLIDDASFSAMLGQWSTGGEAGDLPEFGYGLISEEIGGKPCYGHDGDMLGHFAAMLIDPDAGVGVCVQINGPGHYEEIAREALCFARAAVSGSEPYELPAVRSVNVIANSSEFSGVYSYEGESWTFIAEDESLHVQIDGYRYTIERPGRGRGFVIDAPELDREALVFERDDADRVVALHHGKRWLARDGAEILEPVAPPETWRIFEGVYLCHNPWQPWLRVLERRGTLFLEWLPGYESILIELADGIFQVGEAPSADRISFDAIANDQALRLTLNGECYYRSLQSSLPSARS